MAKKSSSGVLIGALIWLVIAAAIAVAYKFVLRPNTQRDLQRQTGSESRYQQVVRIAVDSFSGYSVLRSDPMREGLARQGVRWDVSDDGADTLGRIEGLARGHLDFAVFTIDSLLTAGHTLGEFPCSIVLVLDETVGADAVVAWEVGVPSLDALNHPRARFVATPNSPSEFLARVAIANFALPALPNRWMDEQPGAAAVYRAFQEAEREEKKAFVLWEPFVSRARNQAGAVVLLDSSKLSGYIMDVLVVRREFLRDHEDLVRTVVEEYLRTAYDLHRGKGMVDLVLKDAKQTGARGIRRAEAEQLVQGIAWRNTLENYVHFGLLDGGLPHLDDAIARITDVLLRTGAIDQDPVEGRTHVLFYDKILRALKDGGFHPGQVVRMEGDSTDLDFEAVRGGQALAQLDEAEWEHLLPVGEIRIDPIAFARGTARLNIGSRRALTGLVERMDALPRYYLTVSGHARAVGDPEANLRLASQRAEAVCAFLEQEGLHADRVRAVAAPPAGQNGSAQSVSFEVGQVPY